MENQKPDPNHQNHQIFNNKFNNSSSNSGGGDDGNHNGSSHKSSLKRNSNSHISMSDTESQTSQLDSYYSPLRFDSPLRSDDPSFHHSPPNSKALVAVDKYFSPIRSPPKPTSSEHLSFPTTPGTPTPPPEMGKSKGKKERSGSPAVVFNYNKSAVREGVTKVGRGDEEVGRGEEGAVGGERRSREAVASILRRTKRGAMVMKVALGFRVIEVIVCVISFSIMASDKTQGWAGDSYDRYKEYRYCLAVNVIGFAYAAFQAFDLSYHLASQGKHVISHPLRYYFDFLMDQILAYLLMSASSSAATRVDDWVSNWGKDPFTQLATASIGMSFLAFFAFAVSALISGFNLCNRDSS